MADNKNYPVLGFDLYEGNTINSWEALGKTARFLYLRTSNGLYKDHGFLNFLQQAHPVGLQVGAFHEAWPGTSVSAQVRTYKSQIPDGLHLELPTAIAYEPQGVKDLKTGKVTMTWPNPHDLPSFMVDDPGVIVYTNEAGLRIIKEAGIDMSAWRFWYAHYTDHQSTEGEQDIDAELIRIGSLYGIKKEQVLFFQTCDAIAYPDPAISPDKGADYDRVVSYAPLLTPAPDPTPAPDTTWQAAVADVITRMNALSVKVTMLDHRIDMLEHPAPPAPPIVVPPAIMNIWTLKTREELGLPHDGSFNAVAGHGQKNNIILRQPELDFVFSISGAWYGTQTNNDRLRQWAIGPGNVYILPVGDETHPTQVDWPVILSGSTPLMRQRVHVLERVDNGQRILGKPGPAVRIEAFQKASSADGYRAQGNPNNADYLFMWMWTDFLNGGYGPSHSFPDGSSFVFVMPLFDPGSAFPVRKGTIPGFWIEERFLKERVA